MYYVIIIKLSNRENCPMINRNQNNITTHQMIAALQDACSSLELFIHNSEHSSINNPFINEKLTNISSIIYPACKDRNQRNIVKQAVTFFRLYPNNLNIMQLTNHPQFKELHYLLIGEQLIPRSFYTVNFTRDGHISKKYNENEVKNIQQECKNKDRIEIQKSALLFIFLLRGINQPTSSICNLPIDMVALIGENIFPYSIYYKTESVSDQINDKLVKMKISPLSTKIEKNIKKNNCGVNPAVLSFNPHQLFNGSYSSKWAKDHTDTIEAMKNKFDKGNN